MKNQLVRITTVLYISLAMFSCKEAKNKTEAKDSEAAATVAAVAVKYTADLEHSKISWEGFKIGDSRKGSINISEGYFALTKGKLSAGNFIIDMNTIKDVDIKDVAQNAKITNHLKSADFFNVEKYPTATFTITNVNEEIGMSMIKGNLTIKGIKKSIEFPATITVNDDMVTFKSEPFTIDRTDWDIKFHSGKFFDDLKDTLIKDDIELTVEIMAKKQ